MDGEPPEIPPSENRETQSVAPITLNNLVGEIILQFLENPAHTVAGKREYYHASDAVDDILQRRKQQDPALDNRQIFLYLIESTTVTPDRLNASEEFGSFFEDTENWNEAFAKMDSLEKDEADAKYNQVINAVLLREVNKPDNFSSPEQFEQFQQEQERRREEEERLHRDQSDR